MIGFISMPVTLGLPLATARITSTPPPGPMMAKSPCGRNTFTTEAAAAIRLLFQLKPRVAGIPLWVGVGVLSSSQWVGSVFMLAVVASASITTYLPPSWVLTSIREMAFQRAYSTHFGSRYAPLA